MLMIAGLVIFLGIHSVNVPPGLRANIIGKIGEIPFKVIYGLISLGGLIVIAEGYKAWKYEAGSAFLYFPPTWLSHIGLLLMAFAFVAFAATYLPGYIKKTLRHPMLVSVKAWAFSHLLFNGDVASVILFGSFLAWAVVDRISVKKREAAGISVPAEFQPKLVFDIAALVVGLGVYVAFVLFLHLWLIGVSPIS